MAIAPGDRKYTKDHQWIQLTSNEATIGITDFAQRALGHIVHVELPRPGATFEAGLPGGSIESKTKVIEFYMPVTGTVTGTNKELRDRPDTVNTDCYGTGWLIKIRVAHFDDLLSAPAYEDYISAEM
ncbi:glycine cleavage system protein H [Streptomyces albidus (ex Kaewkla and Franco 2022)]|uniref:glycine cleavage system protein H n=1 Tax=Streptomyces albidus (ex Kaewkla and Franco 2022) TaxID=722709 RepID=UPI0015EEEE5F|nr:glycine cleavage system H protein [Streptomyces albidus (ex Kaewkla and Franco 2022)]